jgi:uncharacterized iron-regulated membrane protein
VTLAWALVVGATGLMNELSAPLFAIWRQTDVQTIVAPWHGKPAPSEGSVQAAFNTVKKALPDMHVTSVVFPDSEFGSGSPYHYLLWAKGGTPLTARLFSPALVDAQTGKLTAIVKIAVVSAALRILAANHAGYQR